MYTPQCLCEISIRKKSCPNLSAKLERERERWTEDREGVCEPSLEGFYCGRQISIWLDWILSLSFHFILSLNEVKSSSSLAYAMDACMCMYDVWWWCMMYACMYLMIVCIIIVNYTAHHFRGYPFLVAEFCFIYEAATRFLLDQMWAKIENLFWKPIIIGVIVLRIFSKPKYVE